MGCSDGTAHRSRTSSEHWQGPDRAVTSSVGAILGVWDRGAAAELGVSTSPLVSNAALSAGVAITPYQIINTVVGAAPGHLHAPVTTHTPTNPDT